MAKFDPFLSLDCARLEGVGAQSTLIQGIKFFHLATMSRDRLQAEGHQQSSKIARLMEASRTAASALSRCEKELIEVELQRKRQRNLYLAARDERNAVERDAARGCI